MEATAKQAAISPQMLKRLGNLPLDFHGFHIFSGSQNLREESILEAQEKTINLALELTAFGGRIIIGSWYGRRRASVDLGGRFHRSRIRLQSSQVSTIAPELSGRWTKPRRFEVAWNAMRRIRPSRWITQRFQIDHAAEAFQLLDAEPQSAIQVVLEYAS